MMQNITTRATLAYVSFRNGKLAQGYTEYIILLALIALVAYAAVKALGTNLSDMYTAVAPSV